MLQGLRAQGWRVSCRAFTAAPCNIIGFLPPARRYVTWTKASHPSSLNQRAMASGVTLGY